MTVRAARRGRSLARNVLAIPAVAFAAGVAAAAEPPLSYLTSAGARGDAILPLTRGVLAIAILVVIVISALTIAGLARRATRANDALMLRPHDGDASIWLWVGVGVSTVVLVGALLWTIRVLAQTNMPDKTALTIEVIAHQWWWEARYPNADPSRNLVTANEIHIPTGRPVRIELAAGDVIHSFWVPALGTKTDLIPGQTNVAWLQADRPGRFRGQCAEYCGVQHAHMAFDVVAEAPDAFARWLDAQLAPAAVADADATAKTFEYRCGACHTVRGTPAGGTTAPDLTHVMSRATIAAHTLPNDAESLAAWVANPQAVKPGNHMPVLQLTPDEMRNVQTFVATLR